MLRQIEFGKSIVSENGPCYVIAEIGHNHQGDLSKALEMVQAAARSGVDAVKFQKRDNQVLYTRAMYEKPYENENSYGSTYGEHREHLELKWDDYVALKICAEKNGVEFMCAPFDLESVDFLERLGITSFKFASGDITNIPLIEYAAKKNKPIFLSTGACRLEEITVAYETVLKYHSNLCLLHCICEYPAEYTHLNLKVIPEFKKRFPKAIIGYSSHDNGILAPVIAYMLGARVLEKHFTLNRAWKGTDHKFSLEPEGMRKQVRDLRRVEQMLGSGIKTIAEYEKDVRDKMGKSLYAKRALKAGHVLRPEDIAIKSPGGGLEPSCLDKVIGQTLSSDLPFETALSWEHFQSADRIGRDQNEKRTVANRL
jgi:N-acetylneuraminate synthase/sialic acid synthase